MSAPKSLERAGQALWKGVTEANDDLDSRQLATLEAACRQRDRADQLAEAAATGDVSALRHEREAYLAMARLLTSLRLPDPKTGKRPQMRGIRGVHVAGSTKPLTSLERARQRAMRREQEGA